MTLPQLTQFRTEATADGIVHLIFDMPGRPMNVFSNAAIHEIESFAAWLDGSDARGVVVRSGKTTAFCAGADLGELATAYDMIMAAPPAERRRVTSDHFAPIGRAFRKLETAGKPVAAAINGLALGGGCELALGCHYRVLADTPQTALGLPESLVGLLPGGGGTQRLPRLIGVEKALPILLDGTRFSPAEALAAGAADEVTPAGSEIAAAERWVRSQPTARQPWDRPDWGAPDASELSTQLKPLREKILAETGGHYPAPLAILDCIERGLPQPMDAGIAAELDIFTGLVMRLEPRNMIATMFLGRLDYDKARKAGTLPEALAAFLTDLGNTLATGGTEAALHFAGFHARPGEPIAEAEAALEITSRHTPWIEEPRGDIETKARQVAAAAALSASRFRSSIAEKDRRLADYAAVREAGFPSYLGGPFALLDRLGEPRCRELAT